MRELVENIWVHEDEMVLLGSPLALRMTIVKLVNGQLWVHSPTPISDELVEEIARLGEVGYIVSASNGHNLYLREWIDAFPGAEIVVSGGIPKKLGLKGGFTVLGPGFENIWSDDLDWEYMSGVEFFNESVFLHRKSKSLIVTDFIQNYQIAKPTFVQKYIFGSLGFKEICIAPPLKWGIFYKDRAAFRASAARIKQWEFDRIIVTHGDVIDQTPMEWFDRIYRRHIVKN
jgi:hypothetical protein